MKKRLLLLILAVGLLSACERNSEVCQQAADAALCTLCYSGEYTCSFEGISATASSCQGCQARAQLLEKLCVAGSAATEAELESIVCVKTSTAG